MLGFIKHQKKTSKNEKKHLFKKENISVLWCAQIALLFLDPPKAEKDVRQKQDDPCIDSQFDDAEDDEEKHCQDQSQPVARNPFPTLLEAGTPELS